MTREIRIGPGDGAQGRTVDGAAGRAAAMMAKGRRTIATTMATTTKTAMAAPDGGEGAAGLGTRREYITLPQVAEQLPPGRTGKPACSSTIARWIIHGVRITGGRRVMLRGVRLPGGWRTTQEWVDEFLEELTRASLEEGRRPKADPLDTPLRRFEIEQEQKTLAAMGL